MVRKLFTLLSASVLMFGLSTPVFAEEGSKPGEEKAAKQEPEGNEKKRNVLILAGVGGGAGLLLLLGGVVVAALVLLNAGKPAGKPAGGTPLAGGVLPTNPGPGPAQPDTKRNAPDTRPEAHWHPQDELAARTPHEAIISPMQAVGEALVAVGRDAPTNEVRRHLAARGIHVDDPLIEQVRAELTQR